MAERSIGKQLWYGYLHIACRLLGAGLAQIRCFGRQQLPLTGPLLVLSNHQSHLDPLLIGLAADRRLNFVARQSLFKFAPFRWLIRSLDAIPLDREGGGLGGLKETLRRLKRAEAVLVFPEGTRTVDGKVGPIKPGFVTLARRGSAALMPVAIEGAFDAWPRWRLLPRPATIVIVFGAVLTVEQVRAMDDDELLAEVTRRIQACHSEARERRQRALRGL